MGKPWPDPQAQFLGGSISVPGQGTRLEPNGADVEHHQEMDHFATAPEGSALAQVTAVGFTPWGGTGTHFLPLH